MKSESVRVLMCHSFFSALQDPLSLEDLFHLLLDKIEAFEVMLLVDLCILRLLFNLFTTCEIFLYVCYFFHSLLADLLWQVLRNFLYFILVF